MKPVLAAIVLYNRLELTRACWASLVATTTPDEIKIGLVDNGSTDGSADWLAALDDPRIIFKHYNAENEGTARAINRVWRLRSPDQSCMKIDNDVAWGVKGWVTAMDQVVRWLPQIGQVGLKRDDLAERAYHPLETQHPPPFYRSALFELKNGWVVESCQHIMGTCVLFSSLALDAIGDLYQMQDLGNRYGFDDSLASLRLHLAKFDCVFLRWADHVPLRIAHLDPGGTDFTNWKRESASQWMHAFETAREEFIQGRRPIHWTEPL